LRDDGRGRGQNEEGGLFLDYTTIRYSYFRNIWEKMFEMFDAICHQADGRYLGDISDKISQKHPHHILATSHGYVLM
jgi:hypothetical protein